MRRFALAVLVLACLFTGNSFAQVEGAQLRTFKRLPFSATQEKLIAADSPIVDASVSEDGNEIVYVGQKNLWVWHVASRRLKKIKLGKKLAPSEALNSITRTQQKHFAVLSQSSLFLVNLAPFKVLRFVHPNFDGGTPTGITTNREQLWWLHEDGVHRLDFSTLQLTAITSKPLFQKGDAAIFNTRTGDVLIRRGAQLLKKSIEGELVKSELLHKGHKEFKGLVNFKDEILAYTSHTLLRLSDHGTLSAAVPVEGKRELIAADLGRLQHTFVFNDGLVDVYNLNLRSTKKYKLDGEEFKRTSKVSLAGPIMAIVADGKAFGFLLQ